MSRFAEVHLDWGGEPEQAFRLGIGQIGKLQEKVDAGPLYIASCCMVSLAALAAHKARDYAALSRMDLKQVAEINMVRETLLQGLLGAGMALPGATKLVREWVDERPLSENLIAAYEVCMASVLGVEDEKAMGEPQAAEEASPTSRAASTASEKTASTQ
jgi:hypothetical protein